MGPPLSTVSLTRMAGKLLLACNSLPSTPLPYLGMPMICTSRPSDPLHRHVPRTLHTGCSVLALYSTFPCSSQSTQPAASVALAVVPSHLRPYP